MRENEGRPLVMVMVVVGERLAATMAELRVEA